MNFINEVVSRIADEDISSLGDDRFCVYWADGGGVLVTKFPDMSHRGWMLPNSDFDCWASVRSMSRRKRVKYAAEVFDKIILAGCDSREATRQMLKIPEYKLFLETFSRMAFKAGLSKEPTVH